MTIDGRYIAWVTQRDIPISVKIAWWARLVAVTSWIASFFGWDTTIQHLQSMMPPGKSGATTIQGAQVYQASVTKMNAFAFPGIAEHHITVGAGYEVTKAINIDGSFVYSPSKTVKRGGSLIGISAIPNYEFDSTVSQWSVGLGLSCKL